MIQNEPILRSLATIEANILEKLTVEMLARDIHFSKHHYQRIFREIVGDSVMHYVTKRKIYLAAKDLTTTRATILEIALKYGYESHEGFTRSFQAIMGVSPSKYRTYHLSPNYFQKQKGDFIMTYSKNTEQLIRELNALTVQTKETAFYTRKSSLEITTAPAFYATFLNSVADQTDTIADNLQTILSRITDITQSPDQISNQFLLMKTIENTAFHAYVLSLQVGLTISRANPSHQQVFQPIYNRYRTFAKDAEVKLDRLFTFFNELILLIFSDMKKNVKQLLQNAVESGKLAAFVLTSDDTYPYAYIADEIKTITDTLSMPLEEVTLSILEDCKFQLDMISFTADIDTMRVPSHKQLFHRILTFQENIKETIEFFQLLSTTLSQTLSESEQASSASCSLRNSYKGRMSQIKILLFYLKGELQKLGDCHLTPEQRVAFDTICKELALIIQTSETKTDSTTFHYIDEKLRETYDKLIAQSNELGIYGSAIQYLAKELITF